MSAFMPPVGAVDPVPVDPRPSRLDQAGQKDYAGQFSSVFLQGMLKEIFKNQWKNSLVDDSINNSLYAEMLTDEMISQLAESDAFGLNELIQGNVGRKKEAPSSAEKEINQKWP